MQFLFIKLSFEYFNPNVKNREERQLFFRLILMFDFISAHVREKWDYCRMLAKKDEKCEVSKF
jgi:hypothetical protein